MDNSFLCLLFYQNAGLPTDPTTNAPIKEAKERIETLLKKHLDNEDKVIVPSPSLAELAVIVEDVEKVIKTIKKSRFMEIADFDVRCAQEWGEIAREARVRDDKKSGSQADWEKIKFDRQIAVIAKVNGAEVLYTDDGNQAKFAEMLGMKVMHSWDIKVPPK